MKQKIIHHHKLIAAIGALILLALLIYSGVKYYKEVLGATYLFTQTDWAGGIKTV